MADLPTHRPKLTTIERMEKKYAAARLARRGYSLNQIADDLNVSTTAVYNWLREVKAEHAKRDLRDRDELREEQRERILEVMQEAWEGWERSKEDASKREEEEAVNTTCVACGGRGESRRGGDCQLCQGRGHRMVGGRVKNTWEGRHGDPAYLGVVRQCVKDLRDMYGLDEPAKVEAKVAVATLTWDDLYKGLPQDNEGNVTVVDEVEDEIRKMLSSSNNDGSSKSERNGNHEK